VIPPALRETGAAAGDAGASPVATLDGPPRLLWHEDLPNVTNQVSPPQMITNPQCHP
jgi:hypothetical protein